MRCGVVVKASVVVLWLGSATSLVAQSPNGQLEATPMSGSGLPGQEYRAEIIRSDGRLLSIQVNVGKWQVFDDLVKGVKFVSEDGQGKRYEAQVGPCDGTWQKAFEVPKGVRLVGVSGSYGLVMDGLRFHFSDGNSSPLYGGKGGDFEFRIAVKEHDRGPGSRGGRFHKTVRGLWGTATADSFLGLGLLVENRPFER